MDIKEIEERKEQVEKEIEKIIKNFMKEIHLEDRVMSVDVVCVSGYKPVGWNSQSTVDIKITI